MSEQSKDVIERARRDRKLIREKLWDLRNPGKRRGYDKRSADRITAWAKANREKVRAANRRYYQSERGKEKNRQKKREQRLREKERNGQRAGQLA